MSTRETYDDRDDLAQLGYETRDISIGVVNKVMWWFFIFAGAFIAISLGIYQLMVPGGVGEKEPAARRKLPPEPNPLLQSNVTAVQDMVDLRKRELNGLRSYGWVDRNAGIGQIPIDRAIDILARDRELTRSEDRSGDSPADETMPTGGSPE